MLKGAFTAIITPFSGDDVDYKGLNQLVDFQIQNGITGILAVGTTGESPVLSWEEHNRVIENIADETKGKCVCIAGAGSNNTKESLSAAEHAVEAGVDAILLVDPYYNGPSSLEIRKEYVTPIAKALPGIQIIPYVIPGRTGAHLLPEDLAFLYRDYKNVATVKEATGNIENMKRTRACCGDDFTILSGDDGITFKMMTDPEILSAGVISVASNVAPKAVVKMATLLNNGDIKEAEKLKTALDPLFGLVTVITSEETEFGNVTCRARNPLGYKALMSILGMPSGGCRRPLGKMSKAGLEIVIDAARSVQTNNPEILAPIAEFFGINIEERIENPKYREGLYYESYS